mgnify:FL=1
MELEIAEENQPLPQEKTVDEGLEELKQQLENERQARLEAERRAHQAAEQVHKANLEVEDTNLHLVNNAIETIKRDTGILKNAYKEAMSVGDYDRAA